MGHTAFDQQVVVKVNDKLTSWTIFLLLVFFFLLFVWCVFFYIFWKIRLR